MFPNAERIWPLLQDVRKEGYLPFLLLVPDRNGLLADHPHPVIHSEIETVHMDEMKEMVAR